jgi:hypothetical protein
MNQRISDGRKTKSPTGNFTNYPVTGEIAIFHQSPTDGPTIHIAVSVVSRRPARKSSQWVKLRTKSDRTGSDQRGRRSAEDGEADGLGCGHFPVAGFGGGGAHAQGRISRRRIAYRSDVNYSSASGGRGRQKIAIAIFFLAKANCRSKVVETS